MSKNVLTIGGSDPYAGGGIQTDLKTLENYQVFGISALTCIATAENGKFMVHDLPAKLLEEQLFSLPENFIDGIKIGLIHNPEMIPIIRDFLLANPEIPVVLDPVFVFKETERTYEEGYLESIKRELFPLATVITPNLTEAALLIGRDHITGPKMMEAARLLHEAQAENVIIKGGDRVEGNLAIDLLFYDGVFELNTNRKIESTTTNGAGCAFAAAFIAEYVLGSSLLESFQHAKAYTYDAIANGVTIQPGFGSVWHYGTAPKTLEIKEI